MSKHNPFEHYFRDFITDFGGTVLPESKKADIKTADYLFPKHNVVAELKTLIEDSTESMSLKVEKLVSDWSRENRRLPPGVAEGEKYFVKISEMPPEIGEGWLNIMLQAVERPLKEANKQIRDTKAREGLPNAAGVVLISNVNNSYHARPKDYEHLVIQLLRKRDSSGNICYPHIHGVVFFSDEKIKSVDKQMGFWYSSQMNRHDGVDVAEVSAFQRELQQAWYAYLKKTKGITVRQHEASE